MRSRSRSYVVRLRSMANSPRSLLAAGAFSFVVRVAFANLTMDRQSPIPGTFCGRGPSFCLALGPPISLEGGRYGYTLGKVLRICCDKSRHGAGCLVFEGHRDLTRYCAILAAIDRGSHPGNECRTAPCRALIFDQDRWLLGIAPVAPRGSATSESGAAGAAFQMKPRPAGVEIPVGAKSWVRV
jgi:hypothetical protein